MRKVTTLLVNAAIRLHRGVLGREIAAAHAAEEAAWGRVEQQRRVMAVEQSHLAQLQTRANEAELEAAHLTQKVLDELESLPHRV